ncbi:MAG: hypothetical protein JSU04_07740, partial [Bdellovibrionales bacterium]|nr:hypothetical protein [Bdellovibrionales bacterium]
MVGGFQIKRLLRALGLLFVVALYISFSFQNAFAASGITYTGRIFKGDQPLDSGVVRFDVWVKTKDNCVLYYERRNIDMTGSSGTYAFEIGDANIIPGSQSFPQSGIQTIGDIFNNAKSRANGDVDTSLPCSTFNPTSDEGRLMTVSFTPQGETAQALPDLAITAVPTAFQAFNANKVNGYGTGDLLKVDPTVVQTTYANGALT